MKTTSLRVVLCFAVLAFASVTVLAQTMPGVVTINGGQTTVALNAPSKPATRIHHEPAGGFFTDFTSGANPYVCGVGYTVSDGSPENQENTPASQFVSKKTGTTASMRIAVAFVQGTNGARISLDKNCKGDTPCGAVDKTHLCVANISKLPNLGQSCTRIERFKCVAALTKGHKYWVYVESPANTLDVWNLANTATGNWALSTDDGTWATTPGRSLGAFSVQ